MRVTPEFEVGFRARVLQDCISAALPTVWERRATAWEDARPRASDYNGRADQNELVDRDKRCRATAEACRRHARVLREADSEPLEVDVVHVLQEVR